ncbi:MAG: thioredoxin domain-containing protein, partial [Deltaproteobacteria bacterium]
MRRSGAGVAQPRGRCNDPAVGHGVKPNRLANETSPYLLQHACNPVDWYPWGEEAFARARAENRPILLSVGYSSCHWCHVMERESFENESTARLMNDLFVNVKVDREERTDVDDVYMRAVQMLTGRGGWPMTVFLTPEGKPFYGGTYFPPVDRHGLPGFPRVLQAVARAYREQPDEVAGSVDRIFSALEGVEQPRPSEGPLDPTLPRRAAEGLVGLVDRHHGGLGGAPKFP